MNIFYLDTNPKKCAEYHCDKHVCKMIIEYGQILSTAHRFLDEDDYYIDPTTLYKKAFVNHPSTIWARTTDQNYIYLFYLWKALCREYTHRYNNIHLTQLTLEYYVGHKPRNIPEGIRTPVPLCMPDDVKCESSLYSYRRYYNVYKSSFARWTNRPVPTWFTKENPQINGGQLKEKQTS